jgi:hypothetical protein
MVDWLGQAHEGNKIYMKNWVSQAWILVVGVNHGNACGSSNLGHISIGPEKEHSFDAIIKNLWHVFLTCMNSNCEEITPSTL